MTLPDGTRLGAYQIVSPLGAGGMGEVYRAVDTNLKRHVALKVLPAAFADDPERLARFQREAEVLASLNHPHIAQIYGLERSGGTTAIVMELVEGPTLAERIAQGPIAVDEALPIARQIAEALEAAHEQGIVHRDLKPANIKVRDDGTVKVLDFGLAKLTESGAVTTTRPGASLSPTLTSPALVTGGGAILGTAAYMSPEQAKGRPADKRSDIWAFGCVLFEMLTGRRAFEGEDVSDTLAAVLRGEPNWTKLPPQVPPPVVALLKRCLRKDRDRIGDMAAVLFVLSEPGLGLAAVPSGSPDPVGHTTTWRRAWPAAAAALISLLGAFAVAWALWPAPAPRHIARFIETAGADRPRGVDRSILAIAPDGRRFVYNTLRGLLVRSLDSIDARVIPGTEETLINPFFSPDGQEVAYYSTTGHLKRVNVDTGGPTIICNALAPFGATWHADGTILFGQPSGIMRVAAGGGEPSLVVSAAEGEQMYGPQLLPDGDSVLFTLRAGGESWDEARLVVQSLSSGTRVVIREGAADGRYLASGHLVFANADAIFAAPFDPGAAEVRGTPVAILREIARPPANGVTPAVHYAVSAEGTLVSLHWASGSTTAVAIGRGELTTAVWVDRSGREEPIPLPDGYYTYPRVSPDGTRLAIDARDQDMDIFVWDFRRAILRKLTSGREQDSNPVWSPDGQRLAWSRLTTPGLNLFWQNADGTGTPERLTSTTNPQRISSLSPDGRLVISQGGSVGQDAGLLALDGDRQFAPLLSSRYSEFNAVVSPDGRWVAYQTDEYGPFQIVVRTFPAADQGWWQVTTDGGEEPLWSPDGRELFYLASDGSLMSVAVETTSKSTAFEHGTPIRLVPGDGYYMRVPPQLGRTYDVSPDGSRFVRIKVRGRADRDAPRLEIVQHWTEELKRLVPVE